MLFRRRLTAVWGRNGCLSRRACTNVCCSLLWIDASTACDPQGHTLPDSAPAPCVVSPAPLHDPTVHAALGPAALPLLQRRAPQPAVPAALLIGCHPYTVPPRKGPAPLQSPMQDEGPCLIRSQGVAIARRANLENQSYFGQPMLTFPRSSFSARSPYARLTQCPRPPARLAAV